MLFTITRIVFYVLAGLSVFVAVVFILRAIIARAKSNKQFYGVARQNERQHMMLYGYYSIGCIIMGLVFFGIGSLTYLRESSQVSAEDGTVPVVTTPEASRDVIEMVETATPTNEPEETVTPTAPATIDLVLSTSEPVSPDSTSTVTVSDSEPTAIATAEVITEPLPTAVVNSPVVGLYLRTVPSGEIIERLEDQAVVTLLDEVQVVDNIEWVKVAAASGNEGWVASEYLLPQSPVDS